MDAGSRSSGSARTSNRRASDWRNASSVRGFSAFCQSKYVQIEEVRAGKHLCGVWLWTLERMDEGTDRACVGMWSLSHDASLLPHLPSTLAGNTNDIQREQHICCWWVGSYSDWHKAWWRVRWPKRNLLQSLVKGSKQLGSRMKEFRQHFYTFVEHAYSIPL